MTDAQPLVSIDVVPVRYNRTLGVIEFATGTRIFEPFLGQQALPGVLLSSGESINAGAIRALEVKVGLPAGVSRQLGAFDSTNRDPRGATISIALVSIQEPTAESDRAFWHAEAFKLPFDHEGIVREAFTRVSQALWKDVEFTRALLGDNFTTADALNVGSPTPHASNARRWFETWPHVRRIENLGKTGSVGRPAATWEWIDVDD